MIKVSYASIVAASLLGGAGAVVLVEGSGVGRPAPPRPVTSAGGGLGIRFVHIPGGTFRMGHPEHRKPVHRVRVDGFWMSRCEITNAQYERFRRHRRVPASPGDAYPVCGVSRDDAEAFCRWLSKRDGRTYRLPTDAEWEYAARGGLDQRDFPWGDDEIAVRATIGGLKATPVGSYAPNGFGLCDVAGNVSEYVQDMTDGDLGFPPNVTADRVDVNPCYRRDQYWIVRGGSFSGWMAFVFLALPEPPGMPSNEYEDVGIRLVMEERQRKGGGNVLAGFCEAEAGQPMADASGSRKDAKAQRGSTTKPLGRSSSDLL